MRVGEIDKCLNIINHKPKSILDFGCGGGEITNYYFKKGYHIIGIDINEEKINLAKKSFNLCNFVSYNGFNLPFKKNTFDTIILNDVLEHIDYRTVIKIFNEIKRVLKKKGIIYISVANKYQINEPHTHAPFLKWLPDSIWPYLYKLIRNKEYDMVYPHTKKSLKRLCKRLELDYLDFTKVYVERKINDLGYVGNKKVKYLIKILNKLRINRKLLRYLGCKVSVIIFVCRKT